MSTLPQVGTTIEVTVRNQIDYLVVWHPRTSTYTGTVMPTFPWLEADEFCLTSGYANGFVRSIRMKNVVSIRDAEGTEMTLAPTAPEPQAREWTVKGSRGDTYVVARKSGRWTCNCVAGQFKKSVCRHIKASQAQEA